MKARILESQLRKIVNEEIRKLVKEGAEITVNIPRVGSVVLVPDPTEDKVWRADLNQINLGSTAVVFDLSGDSAYAEEARMEPDSKRWKFGWIVINDFYGATDDGFAESLQTAVRQAYKVAKLENM
jgi:hypothetical protein